MPKKKQEPHTKDVGNKSIRLLIVEVRTTTTQSVSVNTGFLEQTYDDVNLSITIKHKTCAKVATRSEQV